MDYITVVRDNSVRPINGLCQQKPDHLLVRDVHEDLRLIRPADAHLGEAEVGVYHAEHLVHLPPVCGVIPGLDTQHSTAREVANRSFILPARKFQLLEAA